MIYQELFSATLEHRPSDSMMDAQLFPMMEEILKINPENKVEVAAKIMSMLDDVVYFSWTGDGWVNIFEMCANEIIQTFDAEAMIEFDKRVESDRALKQR